MKTQEEIEKKYDELNKKMTDLLPKEHDIQQVKDYMSGKGTLSSEMLMEKFMKRSSDTISIDAQRYILEWVMGHHD